MDNFTARLGPWLLLGAVFQLALLFFYFQKSDKADQVSEYINEIPSNADDAAKETEEVLSEEEGEGKSNVILDIIYHYTNLERSHAVKDFSGLYIARSHLFARYRNFRI